MLKFYSLFLLLIGLPTVGSGSNQTPTRRPAPSRQTASLAQVYICGSRSAYAYHRYQCRGLSRCRAGISAVSVSEARSMNYVPCKICY